MDLTNQKPFKKGFKFRMYPNESQKELFAKTFGCCRFVWNKALNEAKEEYEYYLAHKDLNIINTVSKPTLTGYEFVNRLIRYKKHTESAWLNDVSANQLH